MDSLTDRVQKKIKERDTSMRAVSIEAGLDESALKKIVKGVNKNPGVHTIASIARVLDCDVDWLLTGKEASTQQKNIIDDVPSEMILDNYKLGDELLTDWLGRTPKDKEVKEFVAKACIEAQSLQPGFITASFFMYILERDYSEAKAS